MFEIGEKVAIVTGGASGIGFSCAKALLEHGIKGVAILDIDEQRGQAALETLHIQFGNDKVIFLKTDVTDRNQFEDAFKSTLQVYKNLDIVINNAGSIMDIHWEKEIAINLAGTVTGTILAIEKYLPIHKSGKEAVVLNVASISGLDYSNSIPVYSATKSGIIGLTRSLGTKIHYDRTKVRVMAVCPGKTDTPLLSTESTMFLSNFHAEMFAEEFSLDPGQDVDNVSKGVIQIIREGVNGSAWVIEANKPPTEAVWSCR